MSNPIRFWRIVPQIVRVRGVEVEVNCKQIRFFPKVNKTTGATEGFGILKSCPFQVCVQRANWAETDIWKIRFNPSTERFAIIYGESMDPIDPKDRRWKDNPGGATKVVHKDEFANMESLEAALQQRVKASDGQPDLEFIETVLGELLSAASGKAKEEAA